MFSTPWIRELLLSRGNAAAAAAFSHRRNTAAFSLLSLSLAMNLLSLKGSWRNTQISILHIDMYFIFNSSSTNIYPIHHPTTLLNPLASSIVVGLYIKIYASKVPSPLPSPLHSLPLFAPFPESPSSWKSRRINNNNNKYKKKEQKRDNRPTRGSNPEPWACTFRRSSTPKN